VQYANAQDLEPSESVWVAPPIGTGTYSMTAIILFFTLIQLITIASYLFRGLTPHKLPGTILFAGLLLNLVGTILYLVLLTSGFLISNWSSNFIIQGSRFNSFRAAEALFNDWSQAIIITAVAFVVRDRYLTHRERNGFKQRSHSLVKTMVALVIFCAFVMIVLSSAYVGLSLHPPFNARLSSYIQWFATVNRILEAMLAFQALGTFLLVPLALVAKRRVGSEPILNMTTYLVIPLLVLSVIAEIVLNALFIRHSEHPSLSNDNVLVVDFAWVMTTSLLQVVALSILCYFFAKPGRWTRVAVNAPQYSQVY